MKRSLSLLMLGLAINGLQGDAAATQRPPSGENTLEVSEPILEAIIRKMEKNDPISAGEQKTFDRALEQINDKISTAGGSKTILSPFEQNIYNQGLINRITPTINDILEGGLNYPWGMDLNLLEQRGTKLRQGSVPKGGADLSSVVTSFQKQLENSVAKKRKYTQEKNEIIQKIKKITEDTKSKLDALSSLNFMKKRAIQEEERAAIEPLNKMIIQLSKDLKGVEEANETAIKSIMAITKLDRQKVEAIPDITTWKEMKAHPETMPHTIEPTVFLHRKLRIIFIKIYLPTVYFKQHKYYVVEMYFPYFVVLFYDFPDFRVAR